MKLNSESQQLSTVAAEDLRRMCAGRAERASTDLSDIRLRDVDIRQGMEDQAKGDRMRCGGWRRQLGERCLKRVRMCGWPLLLFWTGTGISWLFTAFNVSEYMTYRNAVFKAISEAVAIRTLDSLETGIRQTSIPTSLEQLAGGNVTYYSQAVFNQLANSYLSYDGNTTILSYLARIRPADREAFLEYARESFPNLPGGYNIWEMDSEGDKVISSNTTEDVFPVLYQQPVNNYHIYGFDAGSEPVRRKALDSVIETLEPVLTEGLFLADTGLPGIIYFQPIVIGVEVEGVFARVLRVSAIVEEVMTTRDFYEAMPHANMRVYLTLEDGRTQFILNTADVEPLSDLEYLKSIPQENMRKTRWFTWTWRVSETRALTDAVDVVVVMTASFKTDAFLFAPLVVGCVMSCLVAALVHKRLRLTMELQAALEESEKQSSFKTQFVADMSHEIRTPMNGILGMAELMMDQPLSPISREYANVIVSCGTILGGLISDILDFSKISAGKVAIHSTRTYLRTLFYDVAQVMKSTYRAPPNASGVLFNVHIDPSVPIKAVDVDQTRLRQIIVNIVTNAFKFTDKGSIDIMASLVRDDSDDDAFQREPSEGCRSAASELETGDSRKPDERRGCPECVEWSWRSLRRCATAARSQQGSVDPKRQLRRRRGRRRTLDEEDAPRLSAQQLGRRSAQEPRPPIPAGHALLVIAVQDTGIGIAPDVLSRLFKPFEQGVRTERSRAVGGTGLGLTISRSLCELMGGKLTCVSEVGQGTTFTCTVLVRLREGDCDSISDSEGRRRATFSAAPSAPASPHLTQDLASGLTPDAHEERWSWDLTGISGPGKPANDRLRHDAEREAFAQVGSGLNHPLEPSPTTHSDSPRTDVSDKSQGVDAFPRSSSADSARSNGPAKSAAVRSERLTSAVEGDTSTGSLVLVADDGRINRLLLTRMLEDMGMTVSTAANGKDAVKLCASQQFSLVLMDMFMPVMDGLEATTAIRASEGPNTNTPIVFVTATASDEARIACLKAGGTDYITKPVTQKSVMSKLVEHLVPDEVEYMEAAWKEHHGVAEDKN